LFYWVVYYFCGGDAFLLLFLGLALLGFGKAFAIFDIIIRKSRVIH
jgi:hypothetical protein